MELSIRIFLPTVYNPVILLHILWKIEGKVVSKEIDVQYVSLEVVVKKEDLIWSQEEGNKSKIFIVCERKWECVCERK